MQAIDKMKRQHTNDPRIEVESYEHVSMINRYLFGQMEACTAMITFLESKGLSASDIKDQRFRLKKDIERNLDKLDYAIDIHELNKK